MRINGSPGPQVTMRIRPATLVDQPELMRMAQTFHAGSIYAKHLPWSEEGMGELIVLCLERGIIFVAEVVTVRPRDPEAAIAVQEEGEATGELHGMIALFAFPHPISRLPYAEEMAFWVDPDTRGGTLGAQLIVVAEEWGRQNGLSMLKMVAPEGSKAGKFYARRGYVPLETSFIKRLT